MTDLTIAKNGVYFNNKFVIKVPLHNLRCNMLLYGRHFVFFSNNKIFFKKYLKQFFGELGVFNKTNVLESLVF